MSERICRCVYGLYMQREYAISTMTSYTTSTLEGVSPIRYVGLHFRWLSALNAEHYLQIQSAAKGKTKSTSTTVEANLIPLLVDGEQYFMKRGHSRRTYVDR